MVTVIVPSVVHFGSEAIPKVILILMTGRQNSAELHKTTGQVVFF